MSEAVVGIIDSCGGDVATWLSNSTDSLIAFEPLANSRHSNEPIRFTGYDKAPVVTTQHRLFQDCGPKPLFFLLFFPPSWFWRVARSRLHAQ